MNSGVSVRLIIAVYKNTTFLKKVLDSVEQQTYRNFNVSIVEDGNSEVMRNFIAQIAYSFPVTHYTQEDIGFRKNKILNVALRDAHEDLCVFIDGDCVLHPTYLKTYVKYFFLTHNQRVPGSSPGGPTWKSRTYELKSHGSFFI